HRKATPRSQGVPRLHALTRGCKVFSPLRVSCAINKPKLRVIQASIGQNAPDSALFESGDSRKSLLRLLLACSHSSPTGALFALAISLFFCRYNPLWHQKFVPCFSMWAG